MCLVRIAYLHVYWAYCDLYDMIQIVYLDLCHTNCVLRFVWYKLCIQMCCACIEICIIHIVYCNTMILYIELPEFWFVRKVLEIISRCCATLSAIGCNTITLCIVYRASKHTSFNCNYKLCIQMCFACIEIRIIHILYCNTMTLYIELPNTHHSTAGDSEICERENPGF